jgi:hypothetical protein
LNRRLEEKQMESISAEGQSEENNAPAHSASNDSPLPSLLSDAVPAPALRFKVQFTADQAYVDLLERARDLLWHQLPNGDLAELQRIALEALVEKLMTRKCGSGRPKAEPLARDVSSDAAPARLPPRDHEDEARGGSLGDDAPARNPIPMSDVSATPAPAPHSSRHIPAAVRRQVWERDDGRCTFSDARGVRCRATRAIEFHHGHPYALGGSHCAENITLHCRSHNALAAEGDFGRDVMAAVKHDPDPTRRA